MATRARISYPETKTVDVVDDYHGTAVADPYRWLEDLDAEETAAWVAAQNEVTEEYLATIGFRDALRARLTEIWDNDDLGVPGRYGSRLFQMRRAAGQQQSTLVMLEDGSDEPVVLLDPNTWSDDGTVALTGTAITLDGRLLAYGTSEGGSDRQVWRVLDVATRTVLDDELRDVKFTQPSWLVDGSGFFYGHYPQGTDDFAGLNVGQRLMLHQLGTPQADDAVVYEDPEHPDRLYGAETTDDGRFLLITIARGSEDANEMHLKRLDVPDTAIEALFTGFDAMYAYVRNDGDRFTFFTNAGAPLGRVFALDLSARDERRELIATRDATLLGVSSVGNRLFGHYLRDAASEIVAFDRDGTVERTIELPGLGTAVGFGGRDEHTDTYFAFDSFDEPSTIYRYDIETGATEVFARQGLDLAPGTLSTERVFVTSADGTRFPMFITQRSDLISTPNTPTILYGYGGFNVPLTPSFSKAELPWLEAGGVYAVACLRGGGEYGEEWHKAGTKERKQNVFDDCFAAAEWLIEDGRTSPERLAIQGASNGGLLVGACITQRPDLFRAAHASVGVLDMLRYHRFTIGWAWADDYGTADDPESFRSLYAYSPLHNVRPGTPYPALIITTGDHDDRVVPAHSFKFAATIQPAQGGDAPILLRVDVRAGHGMGKPAAKLIESNADVFAFLMHELGLPYPPR